MSSSLSAIFYLISGVLFILALRGLSSPETSMQGNLFGILGLVIAIVDAFLLIGKNSPDLSRLSEINWEIFLPTFGAGIRLLSYGFDFGYTAGEQGHPRANTMFFSVNIKI